MPRRTHPLRPELIRELTRLMPHPFLSMPLQHCSFPRADGLRIVYAGMRDTPVARIYRRDMTTRFLSAAPKAILT